MSHVEREAGFMDLCLSSEFWYLFEVIVHERMWRNELRDSRMSVWSKSGNELSVC